MNTHRISIETPVQFSDPLPDAVDVVIIGGGVIGIFTALYLVEAGKRVLVCEKGRIAGEQSSRNWGWIRQHMRDEAELPIALQALRLWKDVDQRLGGAPGVRTTGVSYLTTKQTDLARYEDWVVLARRHGLHSEMMTRAQIADAFTGHAIDRWVGGVSTPSDCKGEPWQAVPAVAGLAHELGAMMREDCAVRRLDMQDGQVTGVVTEHGSVRCDQVVVAAGAWSRLFLGAHGAKIPQLSVVATAAQTDPMIDFNTTSAVDDELALRRRDDGGYTLALADLHGFHVGRDVLGSLRHWLPQVRKQWRELKFSIGAPAGFPDAWRTPRQWVDGEVTPFERTRVLEPEPMKQGTAMMADRFVQRFPRLGKPQIKDTWAGMIDAMPDNVPIVDEVPGLGGVTLATGMSGHGFGIGPGFGRVIARRLTGQPDEHDLKRFRFGRFTDGSRLQIGPGL